MSLHESGVLLSLVGCPHSPHRLPDPRNVPSMGCSSL